MSGRTDSTHDPRQWHRSYAAPGIAILTDREWIVGDSNIREESGVVSESLTKLSNKLDSLAQEVCDRPEIWNGQLRDLGRCDLSLATPLLIVYERYADEDTVSARFDEVGAYGEGATEIEAILNLQENLCALYEDLINTDPEEIGPLLEEWLRILKQVIVEA